MISTDEITVTPMTDKCFNFVVPKQNEICDIVELDFFEINAIDSFINFAKNNDLTNCQTLLVYYPALVNYIDLDLLFDKCCTELSFQTAKYLLREFPTITMKSYTACQILDRLCFDGDIKFYRWFIKKFDLCPTNNQINILFLTNCLIGNIECIQIIKKIYGFQNIDYHIGLILSCTANNTILTRYLLQHDHYSLSEFVIAAICESNNLDFLIEIIDSYSIANITSKTIKQYMINNISSLIYMNEWFDDYPKIDFTIGELAVYISCKNNNYQMLKFLLEKFPDIDICSHNFIIFMSSIENVDNYNIQSCSNIPFYLASKSDKIDNYIKTNLFNNKNYLYHKWAITYLNSKDHIGRITFREPEFRPGFLQSVKDLLG